MRLTDLARCITTLESNQPIICPFCESVGERVDALSSSDLRDLIAYTDGKCVTMSPELEAFLFHILKSSPSCPHCRETAAMSEEEAEEEGRRLADILRDVI